MNAVIFPTLSPIWAPTTWAFTLPEKAQSGKTDTNSEIKQSTEETRSTWPYP